MKRKQEYNWMKAKLCEGSLVFEDEDGLLRALEDGFFFVEHPSDMDFSPGDRFARSFYLPTNPETIDPYRGFSKWTSDYLDKYEGYYCRDTDQTEQFFLENRFWDSVFPSELARLAVSMKEFALEILKAILLHLDLPQELWDEATGRCLSLQGIYHLTFNHFRSNVRARGLNIHKDSGWVTVLRSIDPGLEVQKGDVWYPLNPIPGSVIVNFGCAIEILTRRSRTPIAAVAHRVVEQSEDPYGKPDRFSYALFVDSSLDETICPGLYCYEPGKGLVLETRFSTFLDQILKNTYQANTTGLY